MQLALLDPANRDQLTPAGRIGRPGVRLSIPASDQHGLATQQAGGIIGSNAKLSQLLQGRLDGQQERLESGIAFLRRRLEFRTAHRLSLIEGSDAGAPKRDQVSM